MALLTKVKSKMAIHAHRKVRGLLDGEYASVHTGRSMDFNDLRAYVVGDDVKDLDWRASARHNGLLVRRYVADRKHTVCLTVATGRSMAAMCDAFDTKRDLAIMAAGIIGWLAVRHGDHVCAVLGDGGGTQLHRPTSQEVGLERILVDVQSRCSADGAAPDLQACLDAAIRTVRRQTIMLVLADDVDLDEQNLESLKRLRAQHEVLFISVADLNPTDPSLGDRAVVSQDTGSRLPAFLRYDAALRAELAQADADRLRRRTKALDRLGIASEHVTSEADVVPSIFALLERHRHA